MVTLRPSEVYTAVERGVVDGFALSTVGMIVDAGLYEVTKYTIDHPFLNTNFVVIMNLDSWNRIPKNLQDLLRETASRTRFPSRD